MDLKDSILTAAELDSEIITIKGQKVLIREMTGAERDQIIRDSMVKGKMDDVKFGVNLIAHCTRDPEAGKPLFTVAEVEKLKAQSWRVIGELESAVLRVNGLGEAERKATEKNS